MMLPKSPLTYLALPALLFMTSAAGAESFKELVSLGDTQDRTWNASEALKYYLPAEKLEPNNDEVLTRIARQYRHLASDSGDIGEKKRLGNLALTYAQRAVALDPKDSDCQLSVAISYGKLMPVLGKKEQVAASSQMKAYAERALALNPRDDMAWHVLGRWHQVLADVKGLKRKIGSMLYGNLPSTTPEEAVKCFRKAIELDGSKPRHYIELGRTYAQMGRKEEARQYINKGLAMTNVEKDDAEVKAKGRQTLAEL